MINSNHLTEEKLRKLGAVHKDMCHLVRDTKQRLHLLSYQDSDLNNICTSLEKLSADLDQLNLITTPSATEKLTTMIASFEEQLVEMP